MPSAAKHHGWSFTHWFFQMSHKVSPRVPILNLSLNWFTGESCSLRYSTPWKQLGGENCKLIIDRREYFSDLGHKVTGTHQWPSGRQLGPREIEGLKSEHFIKTSLSKGAWFPTEALFCRKCGGKLKRPLAHRADGFHSIQVQNAISATGTKPKREKSLIQSPDFLQFLL